MPTIAARTFSAGVQTLGPFPVALSWSRLELHLDMAALVTAPLWLTIEYAPDGVTWRPLVKLDYKGPYINPRTLLSSTDADLAMTLGTPASGASPQVRLIFDNPVSFVSSGGSVVVS